VVRRVITVLSVALLLLGAPGGSAKAANGPADDRPQDPGESRDRRYMMGTSIEVRAFGGDAAARTAAIDEAFGAMAEVDRLMSNWRDDSELGAVNRGAAAAPVVASPPLFDVVRAGVDICRKSGGAFDMTVGPLVKLWGFMSRQPHVPTPSELAAIRPLVGCANVVLDPAARTIRFARPGVELDLGGIAKGFAVELAAGSLRRRGLGGFIDAGGNQFLLGRPPGKQAWTIGIQDPDHPSELIGTLDLQEGSVSTSAGNANFLTVNGRRYGHVLDPRTLQPTEAALSVTVWSRDGTLADAASKVVFVLGPRDGLAFIDTMPGMLAFVAYRAPDGHVALAMSKALEPLFRRAAAR
jgi:thiamine biosynthesis lipoprotein